MIDENKLRDKLIVILAEAEMEHPYKLIGHPETYSKYNEGWTDCINYIDSRLKLFEE